MMATESKDGESVQIADMAINPAAERMPENANLSQMQAFTFALLEMNSKAAHDLMDKCKERAEGKAPVIVLYADIFQSAYFARSRSISGRTTDAAFKLAEAEIEAKSGDFDRDIEPRELGARR